MGHSKYMHFQAITGVYPVTSVLSALRSAGWPAHGVSSRNLRSFHSAPIALGADSY